jgi:hypothetical protein
VRQSPAGKNVSTEEEDSVEIRHQATTGENTANLKDLMSPVFTVILGVRNSVAVARVSSQ